MHSRNLKVNFTNNGATIHFSGPPNMALHNTAFLLETSENDCLQCRQTQNIWSTATVGLSFEEVEAETAIGEADIAMYRAKQAGRGCAVFLRNEVDDISFTSVGLNPAVHQFWLFVIRKPHLSKRVNPVIRRALYMQTIMTRRYNSFVKVFVKCLKKAGKSSMLIIGEVR